MARRITLVSIRGPPSCPSRATFFHRPPAAHCGLPALRAPSWSLPERGKARITCQGRVEGAARDRWWMNVHIEFLLRQAISRRENEDEED